MLYRLYKQVFRLTFNPIPLLPVLLYENTSAVLVEKYVIDPDGAGGLAPFTVYCDMSDKNGVGVTVVSHDSEIRTLVDGYESSGSYSRSIHYSGASISPLASLTDVSLHYQQFIKYECYGSVFTFQYERQGWWVSRDSSKMLN